jgi:hypothetical protein
VNETAVFLVTGAIVGATVTLLYVTQNKKIPAKSGERLENLQGTIRDQVAGWIQEMADIVQCASNRGKRMTPRGYERVFEGFDTAKQCLEDGRNDLMMRITSSNSL